MPTFTIAWKEFRSFLNSATAYIFLAAFVLMLNGSYFIWKALGQTANFFTINSTVMEIYFSMIPLSFVVFIPALAMRLWPDELKSGTVELLLTYPVRSWQIVVGKFLAGFYLIAAALLITTIAPLTVSDFGLMDWGPVLGAYIAAALVGAAFLALGLFMGALCREQVTAFILTALICLALVLLGDKLTNVFLPKAWHGFSNAISFSSRFDNLGRGVVDVPDVLYFVSFAVAFLVLNVMVIECRKGK